MRGCKLSYNVTICFPCAFCFHWSLFLLSPLIAWSRIWEYLKRELVWKLQTDMHILIRISWSIIVSIKFMIPVLKQMSSQIFNIEPKFDNETVIFYIVSDIFQRKTIFAISIGNILQASPITLVTNTVCTCIQVVTDGTTYRVPHRWRTSAKFTVSSQL